MGHVEVHLRELRFARQLALGKIRLDRMQRFFEGYLVSDFPRHQKPQRIFYTRVISDVHQPLIDNFGPGFGGDIRAHVCGGFTNSVDVGGGPRHAGRVGQRRTRPVQQAGDMRVIAGAIEGTIQLALLFHAFGHSPLGALVEHDDDGADDLQMAEFFGGDVHQQIFAPRVVFRQGLGEVTGRGGQLTLGAAKLLEQKVGQARIGLGDADGVLKSLVM